MNATNLYLAASWSRKNEIADLADNIQRTYPGIFHIVSTWVDEEHEHHSSQYPYAADYLQSIAIQNAAELDAADVLILFADDPTVPKIGGGKHWEFGYAYARQKTCIIVGLQEHVFYHMPGVFHADCLDHALALILAARNDPRGFQHVTYELRQ